MTSAYVNNANDLVVTGLTKARDGSYINDATITVTLYDSTGSALTNGSGLALAADGGATGGYIGVIPSTGASPVTLTAGSTYRAHFSASNYDWSTDVYFTPQARVG